MNIYERRGYFIANLERLKDVATELKDIDHCHYLFWSDIEGDLGKIICDYENEEFEWGNDCEED